MSIFLEPVSEQIWMTKYRYQKDNQIIDQDIEQTWQRVASAIAKAEDTSERKVWQQQFYNLLADFNFLPGGRILAGAGTQRKVTLFNCFVMDIKEDSLQGIFTALQEGAFTLQQGGGVGYDFSILRPQGESAEHTGSMASGPVSFMRIWDAMSATMQSSGIRRGAMMGILRCDHPDIEEFIAVKSNPNELRHFNISVLVTDEFMRAVKNNSDWALVFPARGALKNDKIIKIIKAKELWLKIIKAAYSYAEPGVLFEDTINRLNPLNYCEWISATNPCGEIPLPKYGACNLGSINLVNYVIYPFTKQAKIDWDKLEQATAVATRFLDNVISVSKFPLKAQQVVALNTRRIGLGFTGLADVLVMLGIEYGSPKSFAVAKEIMQKISEITWQTSIELAKSKNSFPLFNKKLYLKTEFVKNLPQYLLNDIAKYGMRNSHHNAIAPTGTISLLANNVSNGLEPIFAPSYGRKIRVNNENLQQFTIRDYSYRLWQQNNSGLPPAWVDVQNLEPIKHLKMQAAIQPFVDNAVSKTINLPENFPLDQLTEIYTQAYKMNLKGCTIFRPNPITGTIISTTDKDRCCLEADD